MLRIALIAIEEKMTAVEWRLANPQEQGLLFDVSSDLNEEIEEVLRQKMTEVYGVLRVCKERFDLSSESTPASRDILRGLPELWAMVQEIASRRLRGYGVVEPPDAAILDPLLSHLGHLLYDMERVVCSRPSGAQTHMADTGASPSGEPVRVAGQE
jgi:hypothetical protein